MAEPLEQRYALASPDWLLPGMFPLLEPIMPSGGTHRERVVCLRRLLEIGLETELRAEQLPPFSN